MKAFRYYVYSIAALAIINVIIHTFSHSFASTLPYADEAASGYIVPREEWKTLLEGTWKYEVEIVNPVNVVIYEGEIDYREDGTFKRYVDCKIWEFDRPYSQSEGNESGRLDNFDMNLLVSGSVSGKWTVSAEDYWFEVVDECNMQLVHLNTGYNSKYNKTSADLLQPTCVGYYPMDTIRYGNFTNGIVEKEVRTFTQDQIVLSGRIWNNDKWKVELTRISS